MRSASQQIIKPATLESEVETTGNLVNGNLIIRGVLQEGQQELIIDVHGLGKQKLQVGRSQGDTLGVRGPVPQLFAFEHM
jgi:hypothetical protein